MLFFFFTRKCIVNIYYIFLKGKHIDAYALYVSYIFSLIIKLERKQLHMYTTFFPPLKINRRIKTLARYLNNIELKVI